MRKNNKEKIKEITPLMRKIYSVVKKIPRGKVATYAWVANKIDKPKASRLVGRTLGKNPFLTDVPCHRVIKSNLKVGNYVLGKEKKIALLKEEGIKIIEDQVERNFVLE